jgi:branched-chain amino acid transport system ATP-binding protein
MSVVELTTGYGNKVACSKVSLTVSAGDVIAVIGHNGAGKSTLLKAMFGLLRVWSGSMSVNNSRFAGFPKRTLVHLGGAFVPQGARVFADLTVQDNLTVGGLAARDRSAVARGMDRVLALFPQLAAMMRRPAGSLSAGEKQMVALGAALVREPRCLMLDEPTLGLATPAAHNVLARIHDLSQTERLAVVVVEQKVREVLAIASAVHVMRRGQVAFSGSPLALKDQEVLRTVYF